MGSTNYPRPIRQTGSSSGPRPRHAKTVRRRCCRSRCGHLLYSVSARASARAHSESRPSCPTFARVSIRWPRTTAESSPAVASTPPGAPPVVPLVACLESDLPPYIRPRSAATLPVRSAKRALVPDRRSGAAHAPNTPLAGCAHLRRAD